MHKRPNAPSGFYPTRAAETKLKAPLGILPINSATLVNQTVVATFPAAPADANLVVGVVGINFYQQINGKFYALNNNSTNPLAIEYVA